MSLGGAAMSLGGSALDSQKEYKPLRDGSRPTLDPLTTSPMIDQIAGALAKAQAKIKGAKKDAENPYFKSDYADLASVWDACRDALTENGIAVVQVPNGDGEPVEIIITDYDKDDNVTGQHVEKGARIRLTTLLLHGSGQWIGGTSTMTAANMGPQAAGSCLTYLRRYSLAAVAGVAPKDDDGNEASKPSGKRSEPIKGGVPDQQLERIRELGEQLGWSKGQVQAHAVRAGIKKSLDQLTQAEGVVLIGALTKQIEERKGAS